MASKDQKLYERGIHILPQKKAKGIRSKALNDPIKTTNTTIIGKNAVKHCCVISPKQKLRGQSSLIQEDYTKQEFYSDCTSWKKDC